MVKVIVGPKGSGKTKKLVELVSKAVNEEQGDVKDDSLSRLFGDDDEPDMDDLGDFGSDEGDDLDDLDDLGADLRSDRLLGDDDLDDEGKED